MAYSTSSRYKNYWDAVRAESIKPISHAEDPMSTVLPADADSFFEISTGAPAAQQVVTDASADEDIFDILA